MGSKTICFITACFLLLALINIFIVLNLCDNPEISNTKDYTSQAFSTRYHTYSNIQHANGAISNQKERRIMGFKNTDCLLLNNSKNNESYTEAKFFQNASKSGED
ncbi:hypothetical protein CDIK_3519, partial [Cucumispora dikerogammari]